MRVRSGEWVAVLVMKEGRKGEIDGLGKKGEMDGLGKKGEGNGFVGGGCHIFYKKKFK